MTSLKILNYFILQWFFIRLAKRIDENKGIIGYSLLYPIIPLSGWTTPFKPLKYKIYNVT
jgi:hypothetical protein